MLEVGGEVVDRVVAGLQRGGQLRDGRPAAGLRGQRQRKGDRRRAVEAGAAGEPERGAGRVECRGAVAPGRGRGQQQEQDGRRQYPAAGGAARQPFSAPAVGGFWVGALFSSVGNLAVSHSTMPPLRVLARYPSRISRAATCALTSSSGSES